MPSCKPALLYPNYNYKLFFSIEFIYSFNKHSQNPICQEAMLRIHSRPPETHGQGSKGLGTDLGSREGLGVWVGFWPSPECCWDLGL